MSNQVKNMSDDTNLALEAHSPAHDELKKLESCIKKLVDTTDLLTLEMSSTHDKMHFSRCAKAIQSNIKTIHELTLSTVKLKLQEYKGREKDVSPSDWESL
jgi:FtsZ-binding cell division protein ZapB